MTQDPKAKKSIQQILGINSTPVSVVSAAASLAGILWSANETSKMKTYTDFTKGSQANIKAIENEFATANANTEAAFETAIAQRTATESANIRAGLAARGITDAGQAETSVGRYQAGISGAYAAARTALKKAKLGAESSLSTTLSNYYQDLAKKQYESQVTKYAAEMGIWGSLGGLSGAIIDRLGQPGGTKPMAATPEGYSTDDPLTAARARFAAGPVPEPEDTRPSLPSTRFGYDGGFR